MFKDLVFVILLVISFNLSGQHTADKGLHELDAYYEQAVKDWKVPGMAVAIIKDGEVVFSKGYGTRNVDTGDPVDGNTLFAIASNTKAFTAAGLAMLIEEGKLDWDDKVRDYLPWFELYDPYVSDNFTVRDLLTHRSGLKTFSGDLLWFGTDLPRRQVVENARYLRPVYGFREQYGYSNIMYLAAGLLIEELSGMSWDEFVRQRILRPLDMNRTLTTVRGLEGMENVSSPHNDFDDGLITIDWLNWDNIAPAGALISSVNDVSKWLIFQMNRGITPAGDTLLSKASVHEMWAPQTIQYVSSRSEQMWPSTHFKAYGLGWSVFDYHGKKIIGHGGGYDGFITNTTFVPEENLGMVILTNKNTSLYYPLKFKTLDVLLGADQQKDWSAEILEMITSREKHQEEIKKRAEDARHKDTRPTLSLEAYLGTYHCEMYGDARVYLEEGQLMVHLLPTKIFVGHLEHWQYNTWQIKFHKVPSLPEGLVNFTVNAEGESEEMFIDVPNPDFDFTELKFKKVR